MNRRLYLLAAIFAVLAVPALAVDMRLAALFSEHGQHGLPRDLAKLISLSEVIGHGLGVACIVLTVVVLDRANRRRVLRLLACAFGAGLLSNLIKINLARYRPRTMQFQSVWDTFAGWCPWATQGWQGIKNHDIQSFPSSHVATAAGLAVGLSWLYPQGRWLFAFFVVLAAVQRWQCDAHFASDTLAAAALGCLVAGFCLAPRGLGKWFDRWEAA
ncbi:MAG: phosphatase PAP2 family protein [Planctomycetota bacterium]|nr:phosphatase PAP2 family protein [Planctomycetota bacterium]